MDNGGKAYVNYGGASIHFVTTPEVEVLTIHCATGPDAIRSSFPLPS